MLYLFEFVSGGDESGGLVCVLLWAAVEGEEAASLGGRARRRVILGRRGLRLRGGGFDAEALKKDEARRRDGSAGPHASEPGVWRSSAR